MDGTKLKMTHGGGVIDYATLFCARPSLDEELEKLEEYLSTPNEFA
jgi:hypothetical protein